MFPLWNFFLTKQRFTLLVIAGSVLWGTVALVSITKESAPEVQIPVGIVSTVLPGASPDEVERLVTNKIEEKLANLSGLNKLTSSSREGVSIVTAEFRASEDIKESIQKLKDEVDKAKPNLPAEAKDPVVSEVNFVDQPIQIINISTDVPFSELVTLSEEVKAALEGVKGVSRVEVSGVRDREVSVVVRKEDLQRYGISLSQVVGALSQANATLPAGSVVVNEVSYSVSFEGGLDDVRDFGALPLLSANNRVVYLRDVATVSDGVKRATAYTRISTPEAPSQQAFTISVFKTRGEDVTQVTEAVRNVLSGLQSTVLNGSTVAITIDAGEEVQRDLTQLSRSGLETIALVMLCLFLTLGWRESLIAGISIPLSFLLAFIGLLYSGNTINFVSLFSLILAIGILVDSGIVVVEAIHTRTKALGDPLLAAQAALKEYAWPLIGGTMTSVAVFVPLFFISGVVGKFIATIPFTLIFVLMASIVVALGMVPLLAIRFSSQGHTSKFIEMQDEYAERARVWYARGLRTFLMSRGDQNRFVTVLVVSFFVVLSLPALGAIKVDFFPQDDIDFVYVDIEMPPGTELNRTDLVTRGVEDTLFGMDTVAVMVTEVGRTSQFSNAPKVEPRYATITLNLPKDREFTSSDVVAQVKERLAQTNTQASTRVGQPSGGPPVGAEILIKFLGEDKAELERVSAQAARTLAAVPGAVDVETSSKDAGVSFALSVDRATLAQLGITPAQVASTLRTALSGVAATQLTGGSKDVDVTVSLNLNPSFIDPHEANQATLDAIRTIPLVTPNGTQVLLGSVVKESVTAGSASIEHENRKRVVSVLGNVAPGSTATEIIAEFTKEMEAQTLPSGVVMQIGGENEETNKSFAEMGYALLAGLALMFIILVLSFDSFRYSAFLLLTVPLSLIGVFAGLALMGQALSFPSLLGVITLAGVIINHAIILMDSIIQRLHDASGKKFIDIVVDAATTRLRPIFLTTITTVLGMIPLTHVSGLWSPLAYAILFGLSFAMILTLVFIPLLVYRYPEKALRKRIDKDGVIH
jgi:multidrug efflux pump subunit AcrB